MDMLARPGPFIAPYAQRLAFIDLLTVAWFALAYGLALKHRRRTPLHGRYMASTALLVLPPALVRALAMLVPGVSSFDMAFHLGTGLTAAVVVALLARDARREGRVYLPYAGLLAILLAQHAAFLLLPGIPAWASEPTGPGTVNNSTVYGLQYADDHVMPPCARA